MMLSAEDRFRALYMTAQNVAYHQRLAARGAEILRRSHQLMERSRAARVLSREIRHKLHDYLSLRLAGPA